MTTAAFSKPVTSVVHQSYLQAVLMAAPVGYNSMSLAEYAAQTGTC